MNALLTFDSLFCDIWLTLLSVPRPPANCNLPMVLVRLSFSRFRNEALKENMEPDLSMSWKSASTFCNRVKLCDERSESDRRLY